MIGQRVLSEVGVKHSRRLTIELTNICNLHCSYCVRDEDLLYNTPAGFFSVELLGRIIQEASEAFGLNFISFTGGEPAIHPQFEQIIRTVSDAGLKCGFVTNGWHFDRVFPTLLKYPGVVANVAFSLDGATQQSHDHWRGAGSFVRLVRAITRCYSSGIPFNIKVGLRRDTLPELQNFAVFAARLGAFGLDFAHLLPTSLEAHKEFGLSEEERSEAEHEIAILSNIFKMRVAIVTGYRNLDSAPPCIVLLGNEFNVDYRGRLTLCCNLSGYRGADDDSDFAADLTEVSFATGYQRVLNISRLQNSKRKLALEAFEQAGNSPDLFTSSPCLFCLKSFDKIPWSASSSGRSLPVLTSPRGALQGSTI